MGYVFILLCDSNVHCNAKCEMLNVEYKLLNIETQNEHKASLKDDVQSQEELCEAQSQRFKHECKSEEEEKIDVT
jgi:hypothetical protein